MAWVYAQVWPGWTTVSLHEPSESPDSGAAPTLYPIPEVSPAANIRAEIVHTSVPDGPTDRAVLRCTEAGATIQYPTDEDRDLRDNDGDGVGEVTWLSTTPPMFAVTRRVSCLDTMSVIFEGCKKSETYIGAVVAGGPQELLLLWQVGDTLTLRLHGHDREIGSLDHVLQLAFAPAR